MVEAEKAQDIEALKLRGPTPLLRSSPISALPMKLPDADSAPNPKCNSSDASFDCSPDFDVSQFICLVPPFCETEVDLYFTAFERVAAKLNWPKNMWALLLQGTRGLAALSIEQALDYDVVNTAIIRISARGISPEIPVLRESPQSDI